MTAKKQDTFEHIDEEEKALETCLVKLQKIKGYKASGIMTYRGELLASHSLDPLIDLRVVGATFNEIFRSAHEASAKIGLQACQETTIKTPEGIILMRCPGVDSIVHFHVLMILDFDGNLALAKMEIEKMIPEVMKQLLQQNG